MENESLRKPATTAISQCMNLQPSESCLIVTDDKRREIAEALYTVAGDITDDVSVIQYPLASNMARNHLSQLERQWHTRTLSSLQPQKV